MVPQAFALDNQIQVVFSGEASGLFFGTAGIVVAKTMGAAI
jgi:hypothetical protein